MESLSSSLSAGPVHQSRSSYIGGVAPYFPVGPLLTMEAVVERKELLKITQVSRPPALPLSPR